MARQTVLAKISRPRLFGVVPRDRLFALLDQERPLTWVSGPPGSGKTALVASYLSERSRSAIWYQVDDGDTDPATLFHYLTLASDVFGGKSAEALPKFSPEHLGDVEVFARIFFRAFFASKPESTLLVLDNCQEATPDETFIEILQQAVKQAPSGISVVAISRTDPLPALAQLAASGAMLTIGWEQLQLTREEVRAVAAQQNLSGDWLVTALHQQSRGWAAAVTLMLEHSSRLSETQGPLPSDGYESVFNYFASLIFDQTSDVARAVLLSIAGLPHVTPSMAHALSGLAEASHVLEDLYRRHLFTDRRPAPEPVYQFHALFLDFLRRRAKQELGDRAFAQHLASCAWALEAEQHVEAAMDLWIESGHFDAAIALLLKCAAHLLNEGRRQTLARWIRAMPATHHDQQPWLTYWLGCTELQVAPEQGIRTLETALTRFRESEDRRGHLDCLAALLRGAFVGFHALDIMEPWLDELLAQIEDHPEFEDPERELRIMSTLCVSLFHIRPWHSLTQPVYRRAEELIARCAAPAVTLTAASSLIVVSSLSGEFDRGDRVLRETLALAQDDTASPSDAAWWFAHAGYLRFLEARYTEAREYLESGRRIADSNGLRSVLEIILLWRSTVEWRLNGRALANATLAQVEASFSPTVVMREAIRLQYRARSALRRGQIDEAANLACASDSAVLRSGSRLQEVVFGLCNADILIEGGRVSLAQPLLSRSRALIERTPVYDCWRAVQVWMDARMAATRGKESDALSLLRKALQLTGDGQRLHFLRLPDFALLPQLIAGVENEIEPDRLAAIINGLHIDPPANAPDQWPWPVRIFTLGRFEVEVQGRALEFSRKVPRKTLLLLKVLVVAGGREVSEAALCDALWSDEEGDAAVNALAVTVVRLRKLLGRTDVVSHQGGNVSLNPKLFWVDAWAFEKRITESASALSALNLYGGEFLPEELGEPWAVTARERLRDKFVRVLSACGADLEANGNLDYALDCYHRGIDADPIVEAFYEGLMRCYEQKGDRIKALSVYRRLKQALSVLVGVPPSDSARRLFDEMVRRQMEEGVTDSKEGI